MNLSQTIKARRKELGFSLKELASRSGVHWTSISKIESGMSPNWGTLEKLFEALELTFELKPKHT